MENITKEDLLAILGSVMQWVKEEFDMGFGNEFQDFLNDWGFTEELKEYYNL